MFVIGLNLRAPKLSIVFKIQDWLLRVLQDALVLQIKI